jgi:ABC-type sugar transport system ATPase subunit
MVAELIEQLKSEGIGIFLIDHDIHQVKMLCDRANVMKNGQLVGTVKVDEVSEDDLLGMIIAGKCPARTRSPGPVRFKPHDRLTREPGQVPGSSYINIRCMIGSLKGRQSHKRM